ncbi:hypothetical protein ACOSQ3_022608 [Xanthoceras sorbifolium]
MASNELKKGISGGRGFFASVDSGLSNFGSAMTKSVNGLLGYEGLEVMNPEGRTEDSEEEAKRERWKQEERDGYWKMMQKYIGSDVQSMVILPILIFEPMTMLIQTSDSFSGLLLFAVGFLLFMVAFVKDREFQSFFAKGCVLLHVSMAVWRVGFERKLDDLAHDWPKHVVGDFALAPSWVFFLVYSWREKYD